MANTLLQAYLKADYWFDTGNGFLCLSAGQADSPALRWLARHAENYSFITACNPASMVLCEAENAARNENLGRRLQALRWRWLRAKAEDPADENLYYTEPGYLVLEQALNEVVALAREFSQNAVLYGEAGRAPEVVVMNTVWREDVGRYESAAMWEGTESL